MEVTTGPWGLYDVIFVAVMALTMPVILWWQGRSMRDDDTTANAPDSDVRH